MWRTSPTLQDKVNNIINTIRSCICLICISTVAERYYRRDYQPINTPFVTKRRRSRHAAAKKGVERQKPAGSRSSRAKPIADLPFRNGLAVQVDIWRGLIAAFLIMTLMSDAYRVSGGPDSPGPVSSSAQLGALLIRLKANRTFLPTVSFFLSPSRFPFPFSPSLCQLLLKRTCLRHRWRYWSSRTRTVFSFIRKGNEKKRSSRNDSDPSRVSSLYRKWCFLRDVPATDPADVSTYFFSCRNER